MSEQMKQKVLRVLQQFPNESTQRTRQLACLSFDRPIELREITGARRVFFHRFLLEVKILELEAQINSQPENPELLTEINSLTLELLKEVEQDLPRLRNHEVKTIQQKVLKAERTLRKIKLLLRGRLMTAGGKQASVLVA